MASTYNGQERRRGIDGRMAQFAADNGIRTWTDFLFFLACIATASVLVQVWLSRYDIAAWAQGWLS